MKGPCCAVTCLLLCCSCFSQAGRLQKQINEQVWKPFIQAFNTDDNAAFRRVHSRNVIRVIRDENRIIGYEQYFAKIPDSIKANGGNWKRKIELRFLQRIAANDKAFEEGYYKTTSTNAASGEKRTGYGKFVVVLRKESGVWKILVDADANEKTDETLFLGAKPME